MTSANHTQNPDIEYRAAMQRAALGFMQRHQAEHLGNDQLLFTRAVTHLQAALEVPAYLAETVTGLAFGELRMTRHGRRLDLNGSSESMAVFTDSATGKLFAIPVELIFQHMIDTPQQQQTPASN